MSSTFPTIHLRTVQLLHTELDATETNSSNYETFDDEALDEERLTDEDMQQIDDFRVDLFDPRVTLAITRVCWRAIELTVSQKPSSKLCLVTMQICGNPP